MMTIRSFRQSLQQENAMCHARRPAAILAVPLLLVAAAPVAALDYPTLRNGQWEMTTAQGTTGGQARKSVLCLDASTQKMMVDMGVGLQKEMCSRFEMRRDGSRYISDAECKLGNSVIKSHGVMTMQGDTAYRTESSASYDPPLFNDVRESKTVIEGKYTGACRDGLQPGDMVTPNGQKINLRDIQQRAAGAKGK